MLANTLGARDGCAAKNALSFQIGGVFWAERCASDCFSHKVLVCAIEQGDDGMSRVESVQAELRECGQGRIWGRR